MTGHGTQDEGHRIWATNNRGHGTPRTNNQGHGTTRTKDMGHSGLKCNSTVDDANNDHNNNWTEDHRH